MLALLTHKKPLFQLLSQGQEGFISCLFFLNAAALPTITF